MKRLIQLISLSVTILLIAGLFACNKTETLKEQSNDIPDLQSDQPKVAKAFTKSDYLTRNIQDEVFYFVMPDRFHNGDPKNDNGDPNRPISFGGFDPTSKWAFHGGDIAGLEAKLDYIENLGVSAIWLTPILRNRAIQPDGFGHHGYWVVDFTEIDPHFGSNDDLKNLIAAAHARNIKIFFDIITNHTANVIKYKECHDANGKFLNKQQKECPFISSEDLKKGNKYTPFVLVSEKNLKTPAWLNDPKYYNNRGDSFWQGESAVKGDFVGLDDIDTSQPEVIEGLTEVFKNLIDEFKPDGFRIDTVKHVDLEFWQAFGPAITKHAKSVGLPEFFIFGEVFDGNPAGLSKFTTAGKLPSVLDFGFAFTTRDSLFKGHEVNQISELFDNDDYYRDADSSPNELLNFIGNHDIGRVGHFIQQDLPNSSPQEQVKRSQLAHALMYLSRGVPVIYYGDEQGFSGDGGDVDAREDMDASQVAEYNDNILLGTSETTANSNFDTKHPIYQSLAKLAALRYQYKSLRKGEHINRIIDEEKRIYGFSRIVPEDMQDHLVLVNFSNTPQQFSVHVGMAEYRIIAGEPNNTIALSGDQILVNMQGLSYMVLQSKGAIVKSRVQNINMLPIYQENDRVFIPFELEFSNPEQFNFAQIKVYGIDRKGQKALISFDTTPPYRVILLPSQVPNIEKLEVHADNYKGQTKTKVFDIKIE